MDINIPNFSNANVLVVGDVMLDRYWHGDAKRISPEAPVPVVTIDNSEERAGGAGNVAMNIAALGGKVTLIGLAGRDANHEKLADILAAAKVNADLFLSSEVATITKLRVLSQHQQLIRLDFDKPKTTPRMREKIFAKFKSHIKTANAVVLSDYGKGVLDDPQPFIQLAKKYKIPVFVDPKKSDFKYYHDATCVTPNLKEFFGIVGECKDETEVITKAKNLIKKSGLAYLLITRGKDGMSLFHHNDDEVHIPAKAHEVYDVSGAGDTVISVLAAAYAVGVDIEDAMRLANVAAGIVVKKMGTATVSVPELVRSTKKMTAGGIINEEQLMLAITHAKEFGKKIVMTNGCFDILHAGHIKYLEEAKKLGDKLIVAVNDDDSVRRLKGESRPFNSLEKRMIVLSGLSAVDWVIPFSEDTPERLISHVLPDTLVKGGDYKPEEIAGFSSVTKNGGEVKVLSYVNDCSTTSLIEKVKRRKK